MNHCWMSAMQRRENSVEKMQVFWPWSSLRMSACTVPRTVRRPSRASPRLGRRSGSRPSRSRKAVELLVHRGVQEHRQDRRRRPVDRHRHRRGGDAQVEAGVELAHVVQGRDRHPGRADLAVDVRALVGVAAVEGDRVEGGGQPRGRLARGEQVEPPVGAERVSLAGEHARGRLVRPLEREDPCGEREAARQVSARRKRTRSPWSRTGAARHAAPSAGQRRAASGVWNSRPRTV